MENKKYHIVTWGCQMNEHDSEKMAGILEGIGYEKTNLREDSDLIIFNTCLIRKNAELKVYGNLGELKGLKRENPELVIAISGCMMQKKEVREFIKEKYRFVDIVFGTHNIHKLPELIANSKEADKIVIDVWEDGGEIIEGIPAKRKFDYKAFVNIMYGCNNFCSYCVVPYTRGREKSRKPAEILKEIKDLAKNGYKEVTLLGQNVNSYGKSLKNNFRFDELLREINKIEGVERIRFMTSHPKDLSDELIEAIRDCDKVCNHIHLPVQSGSTRILKEMNRKYTKEQYLELVKKIRNKTPNISLTTDIIVGFPSETEEDFSETIDLVKKVRFDSAFTFLYSVRKGTPASKMDNQVPDNVKHRRFQKLLDTMHKISYEINQNYLEEIVEVLVEEVSKNDDTMMSGRTETNKLVHFKGGKDLLGKIVKVKITTAKTWTLEGKLVQ